MQSSNDCSNVDRADEVSRTIDTLPKRLCSIAERYRPGDARLPGTPLPLGLQHDPFDELRRLIQVPEDPAQTMRLRTLVLGIEEVLRTTSADARREAIVNITAKLDSAWGETLEPVPSLTQDRVAMAMRSMLNNVARKYLPSVGVTA